MIIGQWKSTVNSQLTENNCKFSYLELNCKNTNRKRTYVYIFFKMRNSVISINRYRLYWE